MQMLNANDSVPLYAQLKLAIQERLALRHLQQGDRLPSEMELCSKYGVSRITVRRAVDELVEEGILERRQGKGTFVAKKPVRLMMSPINGVASSYIESEELEEHVRSTRILSKEERPGSDEECALLGLDAGENVLHLYRLMLLDGEPYMLDHALYPAGRYPGFFEKIGDNVSTYGVLRDVYGVRLCRSHKEISFAYATSEQGEYLGCASGTPLFKTYKHVCDENGRTVHVSASYHMAQSIVFTIDNEA